MSKVKGKPSPTQATEAEKVQEHDERGLECPGCGCHHFYVIYTRKREERIVRRRECRNCSRKILTVEKLIG